MVLHRVSQDRAYGRLKDHLIASTGLAFYVERNNPLTELIGERLSALKLPDCSSYAGMGDDRASGLLDVRRSGRYTIAEDKSTAVVYGMPAAAVRMGAVCESILELVS
jgi:hypothetical protein